jgi:multidrug resistance protein
MGSTRAAKWAKPVIFLTVMLDLVGFGMIIPLLPLYARHFGAGGVLVGILFASYSLMQFLFAPLWGRVSDRIGRKPVLLISTAVNAGALVVFGLAQSYWWLLAGRVLAGMGTANISVATAYIADVTREEDRAKGMGLIGAAFGVGFVIGPALSGELSRFGYAVPPLAAAALAAVNFLSTFVLLPESLRRDRRAGPRPSRIEALRQSRVLGKVVSLVFIQVAAFSMLEMAFVLFAKSRVGFGVTESGRVFALVGAVMVLVQGGLIGRLVRRVGERRCAEVGLLVMAAGLALMPLTPAHVWWPLVLAITVAAVGNAIATPSLQSLVSRSASPQTQGAALGVSQSASALARVVGPGVAGVLFDLAFEGAPFYTASALMVLAWVGAVTVLADR